MQPVPQALRRTALAALTLLGLAAPAAAEAPRVVASIPPIGSLAAAVMRGVGEPKVLLPSGASPHAYSLRPSDARMLASADLILWVGEALEAFLEEPLTSLAKPGAAVELMETEGLILQHTRTGGIWAPDDDGDGDTGHDATNAHHHHHGSVDPHLWLDPRNAKVIVTRIAGELARRDPGHADAYRANAAAAEADLDALDKELAAELGAVGDQPYVVFHDAYQYLEQRYGLSPIGSVTIGPERAPGARRVATLRDDIMSRGATCAFREPQFAPRMLESLAADTKVHVGVLDPLGAGIPAGPDGYDRLMRALASSLTDCLAAGG